MPSIVYFSQHMVWQGSFMGNALCVGNTVRPRNTFRFSLTLNKKLGLVPSLAIKQVLNQKQNMCVLLNSFGFSINTEFKGIFKIDTWITHLSVVLPEDKTLSSTNSFSRVLNAEQALECCMGYIMYAQTVCILMKEWHLHLNIRWRVWKTERRQKGGCVWSQQVRALH